MASNKKQSNEEKIEVMLLKDHDYYMQRIGVCRVLIKSIMLQTITILIIIGAGAWKVVEELDFNNNNVYYISLSIAVVLVAGTVSYAVYATYITWLDQCMCELRI